MTVESLDLSVPWGEREGGRGEGGREGGGGREGDISGYHETCSDVDIPSMRT